MAKRKVYNLYIRFSFQRVLATSMEVHRLIIWTMAKDDINGTRARIRLVIRDGTFPERIRKL
ncbi:MAG: hypothetical protein ACTSX9_05720 [Candidatus Njordarchaeales archaeon]